jgi:hypothetical protein
VQELIEENTCGGKRRDQPQQLHALTPRKEGRELGRLKSSVKIIWPGLWEVLKPKPTIKEGDG